MRVMLVLELILVSMKTIGEYFKTKKNQPAENFFENFGFKKEGDFWIFDTKNQFKRPEHLVIS